MKRLISLALASSFVSIACSEEAAGEDPSTATDDGGSDASSAPVAISAPVPDDCITDTSPGEHRFSCDALGFDCGEAAPDGTPSACFDLTVPDDCVEHACGVILNVHGLQMTGPVQDKLTGMSDFARKHGYIAIHPTAPMGPNVVLPGSGLVPSWDEARDREKLYDFLQRVITAFHADRDRIHVTGFSQGGNMTWSFLCAYSDELASVAPAAASTGLQGGTTEGICRGGVMPDREVPLIFLHGKRDALSPHSLALQSVSTIESQWSLAVDDVISSDDAHTWTRYANDVGTTFEFIEHDYQNGIPVLRGHCFPNGATRSTLNCDDEAAFAWGDALTGFFLAHPRR